MIKRIAMITAAVSLSACASGAWYRDNTTEAQFYQDRSDCELRAATTYPVNMVSQGNGYQAPAQTHCTTYGNQTNCTTTPGMTVQPTQIDMNMFARKSAIETCFRGKNYVWRAN